MVDNPAGKLVLYQPSANKHLLPTKGKMLYTFTDCKKKFGSPYQIEKAIHTGMLVKMGIGEYSDTGDEDELEIIQWRYPQAALTLDSAFFYHDLTDSIPDKYYLATDRKARPINDPLVKQFYMPTGTFELGLTTIEFCGNRVRTYDLERLLIETVRMKNKLSADLYKEVVLAFRKRTDALSSYRLSTYLPHFSKRDTIEKIIYEEVF